jgi:hypothetical protein
MHYAASRRDHGLARQVSLQERVPVTRCRIHSQALQTPNTFCESDRGSGMYHVAQIGTLIPRTILSFWYRGSTLGMNVRSRAGIWPECDGGLRMKSIQAAGAWAITCGDSDRVQVQCTSRWTGLRFDLSVQRRICFQIKSVLAKAHRRR